MINKLSYSRRFHILNKTLLILTIVTPIKSDNVVQFR